jgi:hypothetical protein
MLADEREEREVGDRNIHEWDKPLEEANHHIFDPMQLEIVEYSREHAWAFWDIYYGIGDTREDPYMQDALVMELIVSISLAIVLCSISIIWYNYT